MWEFSDMHFRLFAILHVSLMIVGCAAQSTTETDAAPVDFVGSLKSNDAFEFVALGDTAYIEDSYPAYDELIKKINQTNPAFTIHVGDTLGFQLCTDDTYERIQEQFDRFSHPVIYTPGDNEWTDCRDQEEFEKNGWEEEVQGAYRLDRLELIRSQFFNTPESLGQNAIQLTRQSDITDHKQMVENSYWYYNDVLFATIHIVGSADGHSPYSVSEAAESIKRRKANWEWIPKLGEIAQSRTTKAIVLAWHASIFERRATGWSESDFSGTVIKGQISGPYLGPALAVSELSKKFGKPILIVHGDDHRFIVDRPFYMSESEKRLDKRRYENITRLQVFGAPEVRSVKVRVEPDTPWVFSFSPLY